jgi:hypothetical protein
MPETTTRHIDINAAVSHDAWTNSMDLLMHRLYLEVLREGKNAFWHTVHISTEATDDPMITRIVASVEVF